MNQDEKIDLILQKITKIEVYTAVQTERNAAVNARLKKNEDTIQTVKDGQNKMWGGIIVINAIFVFIGAIFVKLFLGK